LSLFFTTFAIGGMTGVLMALPPVDFHTHNSLFNVAHFHNTIIGGVLFGYFAGFVYWFPKAFGFQLDERLGKISFGFWVSGFYFAFMPLYVLGLQGVMRRLVHYDNVAYQPYFIVAAFGAVLILIGVGFQILQIVYSVKHREKLRDKTGDAWNGRTYEWSISSPPPVYNFAKIPTANRIDEFWYEKEEKDPAHVHPNDTCFEDIHMPKNTSAGFFIAVFSGILGFAMIWQMWLPAIFGLVGVIFTVILRTFNNDTDYYIKADTVKQIELAHYKEMLS
jgi:cytochrome o ubiquinol oxidase subunit 1